MNLTRTVIHEIIKQPQSNAVGTFLSESLLPINQNTRRLAMSLNTAFAKDNNSYGNFNPNQNIFLESFQAYRQVLTDQGFLEFTQNGINRLSETLANIFFAKGGFFVFCEYSLNNISFISVYLVRDVEGMLFNKDNENHTFRINQVRYLDTNRLAMGGRINIDKLDNQDNNHISLTRNNQSDISEYFIEWIGVSQPESNVDFTNKLFQIISSVERPINPETGQQYELNEFREEAFELIRSSPNRVVNLRELSNQMFQNENTLIEFAEANRYELDHEFRYDGRALNKFKRISANKDGIRLTFARGDLDTKVSLSENDAELVLIRSRSIADAIRQQTNM